MLKAIKIDKAKPYAVSQRYNVSKDSVYRLVTAFDKERAKDEPITEDVLRAFAKSRNKKGGQTVSSK